MQLMRDRDEFAGKVDKLYNGAGKTNGSGRIHVWQRRVSANTPIPDIAIELRILSKDNQTDQDDRSVDRE